MPFLGKQPAEVALTTGDLGDDIVTEAKMANDAIGLTELKAGTDGEIITWDSSGNPAAVAVGTATHVLTSNGAGAAPTFQAGGGGLKFISSTDISSAATFAFTSVDASAYDAYVIYLMNVTPATDAQHLWLRTSTDGGSSYDTSGYSWSVLRQAGTSDGGLGPDQDLDDSEIALTGDDTGDMNLVGSATGEDGVSGTIRIHGPHLAKATMVNWQLAFQAAQPESAINMALGGGGRDSAADVDAFQIKFASGDIESGTISVFGVKNA